MSTAQPTAQAAAFTAISEGDQVAYYPSSHDGLYIGPTTVLLATINHVWSKNCANITINSGDQIVRSSVPIFTPEGNSPYPTSGDYAVWLGTKDKPADLRSLAQQPAQPAADPIEAEIQAKGLTAPRITKDDVEAEIGAELYLVPDGHSLHTATQVLRGMDIDIEKIKRHTICILTLRNGFTVVGVNEGPVSASNFDAKIGRDLARADAVKKIWPLLGYELRSRLTLERLLAEQHAKAEELGLNPPMGGAVYATDASMRTDVQTYTADEVKAAMARAINTVEQRST